MQLFRSGDDQPGRHALEESWIISITKIWLVEDFFDVEHFATSLAGSFCLSNRSSRDSLQWRLRSTFLNLPAAFFGLAN